ncbi:hypothetical protein [Nocardioides humilatus]|nr:hypothetical protein [Nocardioides humilatus]
MKVVATVSHSANVAGRALDCLAEAGQDMHGPLATHRATAAAG